LKSAFFAGFLHSLNVEVFAAVLLLGFDESYYHSNLRYHYLRIVMQQDS
jgi:hypothetical protein